MSLTKAQQVRAYQQARATAKRANFPTFAKYSPDQPRDEDGRWTDAPGGSVSPAPAAEPRKRPRRRWGPAIAAGLLTAAGIGAGAYLLRGRIGSLGLFGGGAAARSTRLAQTRIRPVASTKPPLGGAKPPPPPRPTKPYTELGRRQQQRREAAARANALQRGATPKQADDLVNQMRERAGGASALTQVRPGATITTPQAVALEQSRIASEVARYQAALKEYTALNAKQRRTMDDLSRRTYLFNEMESLVQSIARREAALGRPAKARIKLSKPAKPAASKKRMDKRSITFSDALAKYKDAGSAITFKRAMAR